MMRAYSSYDRYTHSTTDFSSAGAELHGPQVYTPLIAQTAGRASKTGFDRILEVFGFEKSLRVV